MRRDRGRRATYDPPQVVANVLVGAEEDEARLAELLQRRRKLTGAQ